MFFSDLSDENVDIFHRLYTSQCSVKPLSKSVHISEAVLSSLCGQSVSLSVDEVRNIYAPLAEFILLQRTHWVEKRHSVGRFFGDTAKKAPFILGLSGSVSVGKSTVARLLQYLLSAQAELNVDVVATDGFLMTKGQLEKKGIMRRKGFPESYHLNELINFLSRLKSGCSGLTVPVYSHESYDIVPGEVQVLDAPDVVILEGLNILQTGSVNESTRPYFVSDFLDYTLYLNADEDSLRAWFIERVLSFCRTKFRQPEAFFHFLTRKSESEVKAYAQEIWQEINLVNLRENILPFRERADLILNKAMDHTVESIFVRK